MARAQLFGFLHMLYHASKANLAESRLYRPTSTNGNRCRFCGDFLSIGSIQDASDGD